MLRPVPLSSAGAREKFGGKAAQLCAALRAGLPVPDGHALDVDLVEALASGALPDLPPFEGGPFAVRSSAVDEDAAQASFAGQHESLLNVPATGVREAAIQVWRSALSEGALAYRHRLGIQTPPRMAVVVQHMVPGEVSGVMFTRNPVSKAEERIIEATWGLGEAVVMGLVTPDSYRISSTGEILERRAGHKDVEIRYDAAGGTEEAAVAAERITQLCLDDAQLGQLHQLASKCEATFAGAHDIEWSFAKGQIFLLQRRAITA